MEIKSVEFFSRFQKYALHYRGLVALKNFGAFLVDISYPRKRKAA